MSSPTAVRTDSSPERLNLSQSKPPNSHAQSLFGSSPLASPTPSPPKTPSKRRASGRDLDVTSSPSKRNRTSTGTPFASPVSIPQRTQSSPTKIKLVHDVWSREALDGVVWVRLDDRGVPIGGAEAGVNPYWWAAKLTCESWKTPLLLDIIGDDGHKSGRSITVSSPSETNIRPFKNPFTSGPRFDLSTAGLSLSATGQRRSSKTSKALQTRWDSMLEQAQKTYDAEDLPEVEDAFLAPIQSYHPLEPVDTPASSSSTPRKRANRKDQAGPLDAVVQEEVWIDPGPDRTLDIPGELVLAIDRTKSYWPATVLAYEPATAGKGKGKFGRYRLEYLDHTFRSIKRDEFFAQDEDGFVTCKLGQFTHQDDNDTDEDTPTARSPSPNPIPPPPTTMKSVHDLSIPELLRYTRPVLEWTINNKYPPSFDRCQSFYRGGRDRMNLAAFGTDMGRFESYDRAIIRKEVIRWALGTARTTLPDEDASMAEVLSAPSTEQETLIGTQRDREEAKDLHETGAHNASDSAQGSNMEVDEGAASIAPLRPTGCESYEALSLPERLQFCVDILVPEAALQLLAWLEGYRFTIPPLPSLSELDGDLPADLAEQENDIHKRAEQLAAIPPPSEWVNKVVAIRSSRQAAMEAKGLLREEIKASSPKRLTGSFTRPNAGRRV
ncbi:hypothetical protein CALVIDRAFT_559692 [Calocera viscosa TUFC12733]|uniref:PWWP domain-containing protein n=1 Tax=Calocera viscosa (strain TUFC12733) TaxID=1330018 RepID=A0A167RL54_CALVF|nr:hypothetical protein CALVIDRAFT_559692 [Calocera viscosa TUFC12733]